MARRRSRSGSRPRRSSTASTRSISSRDAGPRRRPRSRSTRASAGDEDLKLGDRIGVAALGPAQEFTIVGIAKYGDLSSIGGATFAIFDVPTAQKLLDKEGQLDAVTVAAADGTTPEQLTERIQSELGSDFTVRTGVEQANEESSEIATFTTIIRYFLLSFAGIALFVGAFVIFNTLSITVAQRMREFATLRTLGASRRQVLRSVILEALVIGLGASIVGLFSGLALAVGLNALFKALNLDLPQTQTVFATRTIVVSLLVGTLVTLVAGLFPAIRATRVPPIAAVREGATLPRGRFASFTPYIASLVVALAVLALAYGTLADSIGTGDRFALLGIGVLALFIGVAMLSSRLVRPLVACLRRHRPARRIGGAAREGSPSGNAQRNPRRTGRDRGRADDRDRARDVHLRSRQWPARVEQRRDRAPDPGRPDRHVAGRLLRVPGRRRQRRRRRGRRRDRQQRPAGHRADRGRRREPHRPGRPGRPRCTTSAGRKARTRCSRNSATTARCCRTTSPRIGISHVGDSFTVRSTGSETKDFVVRGIYEGSPFYPLLGTASISQEAFDELYERPRNRFTLLNVADDATAAKTGIESALESFPDTRVQTREEWIDKEDQEIQQFLLLLYVLLALSVIVSLFGMVNTLALSVFERTRELGMLRAVGMTRRQTRRMIRHESVITALIGAALGLPLGIFLAALVTNALGQYDLRFELPFGQLIILTVVAVIAGLLAAITPARRAAKLDPLKALQYE